MIDYFLCSSGLPLQANNAKQSTAWASRLWSSKYLGPFLEQRCQMNETLKLRSVAGYMATTLFKKLLLLKTVHLGTVTFCRCLRNWSFSFHVSQTMHDKELHHGQHCNVQRKWPGAMAEREILSFKGSQTFNKDPMQPHPVQVDSEGKWIRSTEQMGKSHSFSGFYSQTSVLNVAAFKTSWAQPPQTIPALPEIHSQSGLNQILNTFKILPCYWKCFFSGQVHGMHTHIHC